MLKATVLSKMIIGELTKGGGGIILCYAQR